MSRDFYTPEEITGGAMAPLLQAEMSVLGSIFYEHQAANLVQAVLTPDMFLEDVHAQIFYGALQALDQGRRPDILEVAEKLRGQEGFEEVGGLRYLSDLVDNAPPWSNALDHARLVRTGYHRRQLSSLGKGLARAMKDAPDVPVDELMFNFEERVTELMSGGAEADVVGADTAVAEVFDSLRNPGTRQTIRTGLDNLDKALGGLSPGQMILLGGRPSMGKSALASSICLNVARNGVWPDGWRVGVLEISAEMDVQQLTRRHISDLAMNYSPKDAPAYRDLKDGEGLTADSLTLAELCGREIGTLDNLKMVFKPGLTLSMLKGIARRQAARWKRQKIRLGVVIVDHVGLMRDEGRNNGRYEAQTNLAIGLKQAAGELGVALIALAQLSRTIEARDNKKPVLNDLRDSGAWEENADVVIGVYRDAYYAEREPSPKKYEDKAAWEMRRISQSVEAIILKVREGLAKTVELWGDMARNAIRAERPGNYHDGGDASYLFDALDPDRAFTPPNAGGRKEAAPKSASTAPKAAKTPAPQGPKHGAERMPSPPQDGPPEPPLEVYNAEEFS